MMGDAAANSAFELAYRRAEARKAQAEEEARARQAQEAELAAVEHVYDPLPYPEAEPVDLAMYVGTGIGVLYGLPETEHFAAELGDWTLAPRTTR
jgi:hypothetical protein